MTGFCHLCKTRYAVSHVCPVTPHQAMKPRVHCFEIDGNSVTSDMLDAAENLLETLTTGRKPPPKGPSAAFTETLYDLCAKAFGTSRDDAKERILAATYGMSEAKIETRSASRGQILSRVADARRERNAARADVVAWMEAEGRRGALHDNDDAPGWDRFTRAEVAYGYAVRALEAWLDEQEGAP